MQTAAPTAGPCAYHSLDRVLVFVFDSDLQRGWRDYDYRRAPVQILDFVAERYGHRAAAYIFTNQRLTHDRVPITKRHLDEVRAWTEAGCLAVHELPDREQMMAALIQHVNIVRPDTIVCVGDYGLDMRLLKALCNGKNNRDDIKVVVLSPILKDYVNAHAAETITLRDIVKKQVPPRAEPADGERFIQSWHQVLQSPFPAETNVFGEMAVQNPSLRARIKNLLRAHPKADRSQPVLRMLNQYRRCKLPDVILALLLILEDAPDAEGGSIRVDQHHLLDKLRDYGATDPHDAGVTAILVLQEHKILLKEDWSMRPSQRKALFLEERPFTQLNAHGNPTFYYAHAAEQTPAHRRARAFCGMLRRLKRHKAQEVDTRLTKGTAFLDECYRALKIRCFKPEQLTEKAQICLSAWRRIHDPLGLVNEVDDLTVDEMALLLEQGFASDESCLEAYAPFRVTSLEDIKAFNLCVAELFEKASLVHDPRETEGEISGVRPISIPEMRTAS